MGLFRLVALGTAGAIAYKLWKDRQARDAAATPAYDRGDVTPPHGDPLIGAATASWEPEPATPAAQSSRGFGES
ncbi:hypothetical protein [Pseudoxanthomonas sp. USHLN014]|uniref:hypothetical protein n=1 Tax=Pseudoxanthomonas sp. USHLN014 TaxID=3081297 RepID=UPI00301CA647